MLLWRHRRWQRRRRTDGTRRSRSTSSRPKLSRSAGICAVNGAARMPAAQITVALSMCSPLESVTPDLSSDATPAPSRVSTPSLRSASSMTGRGPAPISGAIALFRSTMMTRGLASLPRIARSLAGISVAVSMPVNPPPATTTVSRAVPCRPIGQAMQMPVERDRVVELVDAEARARRGREYSGGTAGCRWPRPADRRGASASCALGGDELHARDLVSIVSALPCT